MEHVQLTALDDLVKHVGRYPESAFLFVREGLHHVAEKIHGPESPVHKAVQEFLAVNNVDWNELTAQYYSGALPESLTSAVDGLGGWDKLNRHVSGRELCWGLREYALNRWGLLARNVLESWNIRTTADFGKIVFAFIDLDLMQKQPEDSIEDFEDIFGFDEVFDVSFRDLRQSRDTGAG